MNEFESHENSYDHQHKKRFLEMKAMQRDPSNAEKRRERERRQDEKAGVITIKPIKLGGDGGEKKGGGFKKSGFKSAFGSSGGGGGGGGGFKKVFGGQEEEAMTEVQGKKEVEEVKVMEEDMVAIESDTEDEGWERYDPARPTD